MCMYHNTAGCIDTPVTIDHGDRERFIIACRILHSEPLVIAGIVISFSEAIGGKLGRAYLPNHVRATYSIDLETIFHRDCMTILEEQLTFHKNPSACRADF